MKSFKIKEAFHSIRNGANIKQDKSSGGIPVTRIETISESTIDLEKLGYAGINDDSFKKFYLQEGDILMSHINSVSHLGKVAIFENRSETIIHGMNLLCLKARTNILYPKYAYYFFRSPIFINSLKPITKKSVNQASFNISNFENIDILIPEKYADQVRIATVLSKVEILIKQRKESIDLFDNLLTNTFLKIFGDPIRNEKGWDKDSLENLVAADCPLTYGIVQPGEDFPNGTPVIRPVDLTKSHITLEGLKLIDPKISQKFKRTLLNGNEILMCVRGTTGVVSYSTKELIGCNVTRGITPIWFDNNYEKLFAYFVFKSAAMQIEIKKYTYGATLQQINLSDLRKLNLIKPPIEIQKQFSTIASKYEKLKINLESSYLNLQNLFSSLSQKALKGELDLSALQVLVPEEEYQSFTNDRTEPHHFENNIDLETITVKVKPHKFYGGGESNVAGEKLAMQIKDRYKDKHFSFEMLANFIKKEKVYDLDKYFSSEEIKANPKYDELEDLKVFLESAIINVEMDVKQKEKLNPWLHLNQHFYNAKNENISLELTKEDFALIKNRTTEERSGIYFKIVSNEIN